MSKVAQDWQPKDHSAYDYDPFAPVTVAELRRRYAGMLGKRKRKDLSGFLKPDRSKNKPLAFEPLTPERMARARAVAVEYGLDPDTQAVINEKTHYTIADWADLDDEATETVRRNLVTPDYRAELDSFLFYDEKPPDWKIRFGLSGDKAKEKAHAEGRKVVRALKESLRACKLHKRGDPNALPEFTVWVPDTKDLLAVQAYACDIRTSVHIRQSRYNDGFLEDLHDRLPNTEKPYIMKPTRSDGIRVVIPIGHRVTKPPKCTLQDLMPVPARYAIPLPLGMSNTGPLWIDLVDAPHVLIGGATGSGKSTLMHAQLNILFSLNGVSFEDDNLLPPDFAQQPEMTEKKQKIEFWGIDLKLVELSRYEHLFHRLALDEREAEKLIEDLLKYTQERLQHMREARVNLWHSGLGPRVVLIVDELAEVTLSSKEATALLLRISQIGRAAGVHLILATQRPSVQVVPGDIKANLPVRFSLALPTQQDSRVILDIGGAEQLSPPGEAIVVIGHRRVDLSTPNYRAPQLLDGGIDRLDPRLLGLSADERAVLRAVQNGECKPTMRGIKAHFHWGHPRVKAALAVLRALGLLEKAAEDDKEAEETEEAQAQEEKAPDVPDVPDGVCSNVLDVPEPPEKTGIDTDQHKNAREEHIEERIEEHTNSDTQNNAQNKPSADVSDLLHAYEAGECALNVRAVKTHFGWGSNRAHEALKALRAGGHLEKELPTEEPPTLTTPEKLTLGMTKVR